MRDDPEPGVEIRFVFPKSPAEAAGLKAGDRITKIGFTGRPGRSQLPRGAQRAGEQLGRLGVADDLLPGGVPLQLAAEDRSLAAEIIASALERGADDNITAVTIEVGAAQGTGLSSI